MNEGRLHGAVCFTLIFCGLTLEQKSKQKINKKMKKKGKKEETCKRGMMLLD